ncbi:MAG: RNA polymerase sigma factor [Actinomycetota bacterium]
MTPQRRSEFETQWPELARRLSFFLARSGVQGDMRDDVIQDTALRLYGMWMRVENDRSAWPLTKTIALNILRDASRRRGSVEISWEVPELAGPHDVESSGIARIELRRVEKALREMSPAHRSLILEEVGGDAPTTPTSPAAEKMMRMRARRKLIALLEKVSILIPGKHTGILQWLSGLGGLREGVAGGFACFLCVALGTGLVVVGPGTTGSAEAKSRLPVTGPALDGDDLERPSATTVAVDSAVRDAYGFTAAVRERAAKPSSVRTSVPDDATAETGGTESEPLPDEVPGTGVHVPETEDVEGVSPPPPPDTPPTKTGLEEQVEEVVERSEDLLENVRTSL